MRVDGGRIDGGDERAGRRPPAEAGSGVCW